MTQPLGDRAGASSSGAARAASEPGPVTTPCSARSRPRSRKLRAVAHSTRPSTRSRWRCQMSWAIGPAHRVADGDEAVDAERRRPGRRRRRRSPRGGSAGQVRMPRPWPRWSRATTRKCSASGCVGGEPVERRRWRSSRAAAPRVGAPSAGRPTSRTKVVPRPGSSTSGRRAAGAGRVRRRRVATASRYAGVADPRSGGCRSRCAASQASISTISTLSGAAGGLGLDHVADLGAEQRLAERRAGRHDVEVVAASPRWSRCR